MKKICILMFIVVLCFSTTTGFFSYENFKNTVEREELLLFKNQDVPLQYKSIDPVGVTDSSLYLINEQHLISYCFSKKSFVEIYTIPENLMYQFFSTKEYLILISLDYDGNLSILIYKDAMLIDSFKIKDVQRMPSCFTTEANKFFFQVDTFLSKSNKFDIIESKISVIDIDLKQHKTIYNLRYAVQNGNAKGRSIIYIGGSEKSLYFQEVKATNGAFENSKGATIYNFKFSDGNKISKVKSDDINFLSIFIGGGDSTLLLNQYDPLMPLENVGKLYLFENENIELRHEFNKIHSGVDIINSMFINEHVFFNNVTSLFYFDTKSKSININEVDLETGMILTPNGAYIFKEKDEGFFMNRYFLK